MHARRADPGTISFVGLRKRFFGSRPAKVRQANLDARSVLDLVLVEAKAPTEFCVFRAGRNESTKGTFVFDELSQKLVMAEYERRGVPMMLDYEHMSQSKPPQIAPASAKSAVPEIRNGELWLTNIVWTDKAAQMIEAGEYRLFSPAFGYDLLDDTSMRVTKLINVALTNDPALHNIEPLMAASNSDEEDDDMDEELKKLTAKLAAMEEDYKRLTATNAELTAKLSAALASKTATEEEEAKATAALRSEILTITGKADHREAIGVLRSIALRASEAGAAVVELARIQTETREADFTATLSGAIEAGKIPPAQEGFWASKSRKDGKVTVEGLAMLKDFVATAPVLVKREPTRGKDGNVITASAAEKQVMTKFGITDPEQIKAFEAFRAAQAVQQ